MPILKYHQPYLSQSKSGKTRLATVLFFFSTLMLCLSAQAIDLDKGANWQQEEFLPAEQAFPLSAQLVDETYTLKAEWLITQGYYLYAESVSLDSEQARNFPQADFSRKPLVKYDPNFDKDMEIFEQQIEATFQFSEAEFKQLKKENLSQINLRFQGCAEAGLCYPMQIHSLGALTGVDFTAPTIDINIKSSDENNAGVLSMEFETLLSEASLAKIIIIFFVLGIGLCLTPCVLPMMPIISGIVLGREKSLNTTQAFGISSSYVLAMSLTYTLVGVIAASLGASANLQIWMQHPIILSGFALLFVVLALSMFDVYELRLPQGINQKLNDLSNAQEGGSYLSAAIMGVLSAVVVSPCISAPLAGALVFISSTGDIAIGASALFALGLGMGLPLIILCTVGTNVLPKAGNWLNYSKRFFGIMLIAVAVWMLARFLNPSLSLALWGALFIFASFSFGPWAKTHPILKTALSISLLWGIVMVLGAALGNTDPLQPLKNLQVNANNRAGPGTTKTHTLEFKTIESLAELEQEHANNRDSGKILLLDFYADWCTSCKEIERHIFENPRFEGFLQSTYLVRADLSKNSLDNFKLLEELKLFGPPAILFFDDKGQEFKSYRVQGTINPDKFQKLIEALNSTSS